MKLFSNLKIAPKETVVKPPKLKRGEYVWLATVYRHKIKPNAEDVELYTNRFFIKKKAENFKKSTEAGIAKDEVRIVQVPIVRVDEFIS